MIIATAPANETYQYTLHKESEEIYRVVCHSFEWSEDYENGLFGKVAGSDCFAYRDTSDANQSAYAYVNMTLTKNGSGWIYHYRDSEKQITKHCKDFDTCLLEASNFMLTQDWDIEAEGYMV